MIKLKIKELSDKKKNMGNYCNSWWIVFFLYYFFFLIFFLPYIVLHVCNFKHYFTVYGASTL